MRLIVLGNCLSTLRGWTDMIAKELNYQLVNFAVAGSGNELQINRMKDALIDYKLNPTDIVIWQIASLDTKTLRLTEDHIQALNVANTALVPRIKHYVDKAKNKFDNKTRIDLLFHSPLRAFARNELYEDPHAQLQELLFMFTMIHSLGARLLVTLGKKQDLSPENWETMKRLLDERGIPYLEETAIDWCEQEGLCFFKMNPIPTRRSRMEFGRRVLIPKLKELGWM